MEEKTIYETVNPLRDYLETLTMSEYYEVRKEIIKKCKVSKQVFAHWKSGNSQVHELAKPIINRIAGQKIFNNKKP